jgi:hypothetical protein
VINTGASIKSITGYGQFQALQQSNLAIKLELDTSTRGQVIVQFRVGSATLIETANVCTLIKEVKFYVVKASAPFLLCLADIDRLQVYYNNT